jgi:kumamolisin
MPDHVRLAGSKRPRKADAVRVADLDQGEAIEVTVTLAGPELPEPDPERPLSPETLRRSYGAKPETVRRVSAGLEAFGLRIEEHSELTRSLRVTGTVTQLDAAFPARLGAYRTSDGKLFRGREGELQIPAELDGLITGVFGLDQRRVAHRKAHASGAAAAASTAPLSPGQLAEHYRFPDGIGAGRTVAIAEFGGGYFADDLAAFCAKQGTPVPKVTTASVNGAPLLTLEQIRQLPPEQRTEQLGDSIEVAMDVQIVAGVAPAAAIVVYFSTSDEKGWVDLLNEVLDGRPATAMVLSVSWGLVEDAADWSQAGLSAINERLQALANLGVTVCAATGDDGSGEQGTDGRAHVVFPASSPYVLAVGGTMLKGATDVVWWQSPGARTSTGGGSTGGGVSVEFARPSWQDVHVASLNPNSIDGRVVPDIAALAGPPLYGFIFTGKDSANGGTSGATPLWAALLARLASGGWRPGFFTPLLYTPRSSGQPLGASACVDVISGDNTSPSPGKGYEAGPGFDAASGWGVPNGAALLAAIRS